jgi:tyrosyl-tRNA synthetase
MNLYEELQWRGLVHNITDESVIDKLNTGEVTFYLGTDPTGDSLHVGHLLVFILAKRLEKYGHHPILLIGGATGFIGDPKPTAERKMLTKEQLDHNAKALYNQVESLFKCDMVNNYDWISKLDLITFLRKYGKLFNVNYMINKETVKSRLDSGISYTEFSYQIGGQDQWGNITSGLELIRKLHGNDVWAGGLTCPLFTKSDGTKFGKTEGGAVWLDKEKTTPYEFYQFWLNTPDADVIKSLKQFTFLTKEEIEAIEVSFNEAPHLRVAQKALAKELTIMIHGEKAYDEAIKLSEALFSGKIADLTKEEIEMAFKGMQMCEIKEEIGLIDALVLVKAASSKREARDFINGGGVTINGKQIKDMNFIINKQETLGDVYTIIRRGKKNYYVIKHLK